MEDRMFGWLRFGLVAVLVAAAALLLAACGDGDSSGSDTVDTASEAAESEPEESTDDDAAADAGDGAGDDADAEAMEDDAEGDDDADAGEGGETFEEFFGFANFDDPDAMVESGREIERLTQQCMAEQGFEYNQRDVSSDQMMFGVGQDEDQTELEYAMESGYGLFTTFDQVFDFDPEEMPEDPNGELLAGMGDGERDAWTLALQGVQPDFDPETGMPIDPETGEPTDDFSVFMEGGGCMNEAQEKVFGSFQVFMELESEFEELEARIQADPRTIEVTEGWVDCMGEQGFTYAQLGDPFDEILEEFQEFQSEAFGFGGGFIVDAPDGEEGGEEGEEPAFFGPPELSAEQEALLQEKQAREIEVAVADVTCGEGLEDTMRAISAEYESDFINENRAVLEAARPGG